jgi:hypothetical protein
MTVLAPDGSQPLRSPRQALAMFHERQRKDSTMPKTLLSKRYRPFWATGAAVAALAVAMLFPPIQVLASNFLGLFRVQQITVLPIDTTRLSELSGDSTLGKQLSQLLSDSVTVSHKPADPKVVADAAAASQAAGFNVRLPSNRTDLAQVTVQDGTAFQFTINRDRAQNLLNEAGHSDLQLPSSLDGAQIGVSIPASVTADYGTCPKFQPADQAKPGGPQGSPGRRFFGCILVAQIPSPTVNTPADLDVARLAEIGLEFSGMSAEEARAYSQTVDWTSTLVVPIPRNGASYSQIQVDGVTANLIQRPTDDAPQYSLVWVKDGVIYAVTSLGTDSQAGIDIANSLK